MDAPLPPSTPRPFVRRRVAALSLCVAIAWLCGPAVAAAADFFQYTDANGAVRVVGSLAEVPAAHRAEARPLGDSRRIEFQHQTTTLSAERVERAAAQSRALASIPERPPTTVLYSARWCGYCQHAKAHLTKRGVLFEVRDIDDPGIKDELMAKTGSSYIPVVERDGRRVVGWNPNAIDRLIR